MTFRNPLRLPLRRCAPVGPPLSFAAALLLAPRAHAEDAPPLPPKQKPFELGASLRARYEAIDGQARAGINSSDEMVTLRTITTADYHINPHVNLVAELWDGRAYDGNRGTSILTGEVNTLEPAQLYIGLALPGARGCLLLDRDARCERAVGQLRRAPAGHPAALKPHSQGPA